MQETVTRNYSHVPARSFLPVILKRGDAEGPPDEASVHRSIAREQDPDLIVLIFSLPAILTTSSMSRVIKTSDEGSFGALRQPQDDRNNASFTCAPATGFELRHSFVIRNSSFVISHPTPGRLRPAPVPPSSAVA
jgi:hypothetical protein